MKKNIGALDKGFRILAAFIFSTLFFTHTVTGIWSIVLLILGGIFLLTSIWGTCPLYMLLGLNTRSKQA